MPKLNLNKLADDLIAVGCFDIPGIVVLLHERVNQARPFLHHHRRPLISGPATPGAPAPPQKVTLGATRMTTTPTQQKDQATVTEELDDIGIAYEIPRKDAEGDADYADRLIYELSVYVEDAWAVQDRIHDLVKDSEGTP